MKKKQVHLKSGLALLAQLFSALLSPLVGNPRPPKIGLFRTTTLLGKN